MASWPYCVALGPNGAYFLNSPTKWSQYNLPDGLRKVFLQEPKAKEVYSMSLGPNGEYVATYLASDGKLYLQRGGLPSALDAWLVDSRKNTVRRDFESLSVTFGSGGSWFAFDKNGAIWDKLPSRLNVLLKKCSTADDSGFQRGLYPHCVSLGPNGHFVFITQNGFLDFMLPSSREDTLIDYLNAAGDMQNKMVHLSPTVAGDYVIVESNGRVFEEGHRRSTGLWTSHIQQFEDDWNAFIQRVLANGKRKSGKRKMLMAGLGIAGALLGADILAHSGSGGGGGGFIDPSGAGSFDMSSFWDPIQAAAQAPIQ